MTTNNTFEFSVTGKVGEAEIHAAKAAALEAGCTHYTIRAPHPLRPGTTWIAAKGRVGRKSAALGEANGNPIDRA